MERVTALDAPTLVAAARAVGLIVVADGDRLTVQGPRGADGLARLLLERKAVVLAALAEETFTKMAAPAVFVSDKTTETKNDNLSFFAPEEWPAPSRDPTLASWPLKWRTAWGRRVNALENQGVEPREAERQALNEIKRAMQQATPPAPEAPATPQRFGWAQLATWRWGPSAGRPGFSDHYDKCERAAIQEEADLRGRANSHVASRAAVPLTLKKESV
jgi:hypothetical protein